LRSTIITTNLSYKRWTTVFPNAACVGALVDRFVQHCHAIEIEADSWRARTAEQFKKTRPRANPTSPVGAGSAEFAGRFLRQVREITEARV